jgi:hypothetical protein
MDPTPCASARVEDIAKTDANAIAFSFTIGVPLSSVFDGTASTEAVRIRSSLRGAASIAALI